MEDAARLEGDSNVVAMGAECCGERGNGGRLEGMWRDVCWREVLDRGVFKPSGSAHVRCGNLVPTTTKHVLKTQSQNQTINKNNGRGVEGVTLSNT